MPPIQIRVPTPAATTLPEIDELKGLAILFIILYHAGGVLVWNNYFHGDVGVDIFFILSGVALALSRREDSFRESIVRRVRRIFPAYWTALLVFIICNTHFLQLHYTWQNIVAHLLGIHGLFGDFIGLSINDSFWFITAILFAYACFYALRPLLSSPDRFILITGSLCSATSLVLFFTGQAGLMGHVGFRLPGFFLGALIGRALRDGSIAIPFTPALGIGLFIMGYLPYTRGITFYSVFVGVALMAAYIGAVRPKISATSRLRAGLCWLGRHSLEVFLIHQPLMREYNYYLHGRWLNDIHPSALSLTCGMLLALAVTFLLSIELRKLQERFIKS